VVLQRPARIDVGKCHQPVWISDRRFSSVEVVFWVKVYLGTDYDRSGHLVAIHFEEQLLDAAA
jgi:hypothetical protein